MSEIRVESSVTDGDLVHPLVALAWPVVVIPVLQVAYNVADTLWLGRLSAAAVGALSLAFPLVCLLISVGSGFTAGGAILVAQYTDAGGEDSAGRVSGQTVSLVTGVAAVLGVAGFLLTGDMLALLPADDATAAEVVPLAADYLRVRSVEFAFIGVFQVLLGAYRGAGNTRTVLAFSVVALWLGRVPAVYALAFLADLGPTGIWVGMALGTILGAIAAAWFTRGTWKRTVVDDERTGGLAVPIDTDDD